MRRRSNFHGTEATTLASVLTGGAFCMFAVTALWLAGAGEKAENGNVRQSSLQPAAPYDDLGLAPVPPPPEADVAPRVAPEPEATTAPLERELAAGDDAEELERDLLLPARTDEEASTDGPAEASAVPDAGAPTPEVVAPESDERPADTEDERAVEAEPPLTLEPCGMDVCGPGLVCCNSSCGICVAPGGTCSQLTCSMTTYPLSAWCGRNTCSVDEVCCNFSCGICAAPGEPCSQRLCD